MIFPHRRRAALAGALTLVLVIASVYLSAVAGHSDRADAGTRGSPVIYTTLGVGGFDRLNMSDPLTGASNTASNSSGPIAITDDGTRAVVGVTPTATVTAVVPFVEVVDVASNASVGAVRFTNFRGSGGYSVVALAIDPVRAGVVYALLYDGTLDDSEIEAVNVAGTPSLINQVLAPVVLGSISPRSTAMAVSPDGSQLLVTFSGDGSGGVVSVPVGGGATVTWNDPNGDGLGNVAVAPNGTQVYLCGDGFGPVEAIGYPVTATEPLQWTTTPSVVTSPEALTVSPDGKTVYIAGKYPGVTGGPAGGGGGVEQFQAQGGADGPNMRIPAMVLNANFQGGASGLAESPDGSQLLVAGSDGNKNVNYLYALSTAGLGVVANATLPSAAGAVGRGIQPQDVAITPDQAPVASLSPGSGTAGVGVGLNASASSVAYGSITTYRWTFGDGQTATTSGPTVSHTYAAAGNYTATVTETDSARTSIPPAFGSNTSVNGPGTTPYLNANISARASAPVAISSPGTPPPPTPTTTTPSTPTTQPGTPTLLLNPGIGPPGTIVTVTGAGFPKNTPITISWSTSTGSVVIMSDANGNLPPGQLLILTPDVLGPRFAVASSSPAAKAPFLVVPSSEEPGGDSRSFLFRSEGP